MIANHTKPYAAVPSPSSRVYSMSTQVSRHDAWHTETLMSNMLHRFASKASNSFSTLQVFSFVVQIPCRMFANTSPIGWTIKPQGNRLKTCQCLAVHVLRYCSRYRESVFSRACGLGKRKPRLQECTGKLPVAIN